MKRDKPRAGEIWIHKEGNGTAVVKIVSLSREVLCVEEIESGSRGYYGVYVFMRCARRFV